MSAFGNMIKARRLELGMSLKDVSDRADLSIGHIWNMESDRQKDVGVKTILLMSRAVQIPVATLFAEALKDSLESIEAG